MMIYCKLEIYSTLPSRNIFVYLFHLDFFISYDRMLEMTQNIYENFRELYENEEFFLPKILRMWLFTVNLMITYIRTQHGILRSRFCAVQFRTI